MDKIDRFLDAIEYPERYTQSEIDAMLQDPEIKKVFDLLDKTKSSLQPQQSPDIEAEWRRFEKNHPMSKVMHRFWLAGILSRNIAATIAPVFNSLYNRGGIFSPYNKFIQIYIIFLCYKRI